MFKCQNVFIFDQIEKERYPPKVNRYIVYRNIDSYYGCIQ